MSGTAWDLGKSEFLEERKNKDIILTQLELGWVRTGPRKVQEELTMFYVRENKKVLKK